MNKKDLTERDICTKFINPAIEKSGWDMHRQVREEVSFTDGRIIVQGSVYTRGVRKRADYILYAKPNEPIAIIEAKDNNDDLFLSESADLLFHYLILLQTKDFQLNDVVSILINRVK